jgi:predicted lipoprotein with Yx(FWY)xxD motif
LEKGRNNETYTTKKDAEEVSRAYEKCSKQKPTAASMHASSNTKTGITYDEHRKCRNASVPEAKRIY